MKLSTLDAGDHEKPGIGLCSAVLKEPETEDQGVRE
jgi:hypothetical protein